MIIKLSKNIALQENSLKNIVEDVLNVTNFYSVCAEVTIIKSSGVNVTVRRNNVDCVEFNQDNVLTITVYKNSKQSTVSSKDFSLKSIKSAVNSAINILNYSSLDKFSGLPDKKFLAIQQTKDLELYHYWKYDINYIIHLLKLSEESAFKADKRIVNTEGSNFNCCSSTCVFGNSLGMIEHYSTTLYSTSCCVIAKENNDMQRDFSFSVSRKIEDLELPEYIGSNSAKKAVSRLHSRKISTIKTPVIFSSEIASEFFLNFAKAIHGNNIYQKSTFLLNSLHKKVFPSWLTIEENPYLKKGLLSKCFDSEGVRTQCKKIVDQGILKTWLLDTYSARKINLVSTGNSGGIQNWLILGYSNIKLKGLLKLMHTGLLITEILGQGVNITTGDYSHGVVGFWVKDGEIEYPVNEITVSGNLKDMYKNIVSISNDIDRRHSIQSGSILLSSMQISGL